MRNFPNLKPMPPPLPAKMDQWRRALKSERTLNDLVEDLHCMLIDDEKLSPRYRALLQAVFDEQAVEGSLATDNTFAAIMIRDKARTINGHEVANEKAATIAKSLGIVMRRYGVARKQRRQMLEGEIVPPEDIANNE